MLTTGELVDNLKKDQYAVCVDSVDSSTIGKVVTKKNDKGGLFWANGNYYVTLTRDVVQAHWRILK